MRIINRLIILLSLLTFAVFGGYHTVVAVELEGYMIAAENQYLTLFFNEDTTEIAVYDHRTDQFWHSNPVNRHSVEKIARGAAKDALGAQLRIVYYAPGDVQRTMDNYNDSIVFGQFEVELVNNGIRVEYVLGKEWDDQYYLPLIVEQNLFENEFFSRLDLGQQRTISGLYALVELAEADEGVKPTVGDKYVISAPEGGLTSREQRTISAVFLDHLIKFKSNLSKANDVKDADLQPFLGKPFYILKQRERDMLPWDKTGVIDIAREVEFDPYIIGAGYEIYNMESPEPNIVLFTIPIEYRLDDDNLVVSILTEGIKYPIQVRDDEGQRVTYPLVQVGLLPYFGAAEIGSDGYMFVPDGSGSLIHFDNGKTHLSAFTRRIYDQDYAVSVPSALVATYPLHLPVFGLKNGDKGLLAIVEDGASIARINADISGRRISYNTIYSSFDIIERTTSSLQGDMPDIHRAAAQWVDSSGGSVNVYQESMYDGNIQVRYGFLVDDNADYVGMAHYYQDYLIDKGYLSRLNPKEDIPLMLDLIGAVPDRLPILGIPRNVLIPLTTYKQAESIIETLLENKINNLSVSYHGWMKNGLESGYPNKVRLESKLGTESELKDLIAMTNSNQVHLYPSVDFMLVYSDRWFDGFRSARDASRALTRNVAVIGGYLLSPAKLEQLTDKYLQSQAEYGFSGILLGDLGSQLHGDYRRRSVVTREEAIKVVQNQFAKIKDDYNLDIQTYGAYDYAFPFITSILGVPLEHSGIDIVDESVPFMPIVLHGFIDYAGEPFNYTGSPSDYLLKMLEVGAKPYFRVFKENPSVLKGSFYNSFYSGQFDELLDDILGVYNLFNEIFRDVQDERIIKHFKLADSVFETVYENGYSVIVNYNENEVLVKDIKVAPKSFVVLKGE